METGHGSEGWKLPLEGMGTGLGFSLRPLAVADKPEACPWVSERDLRLRRWPPLAWIRRRAELIRLLGAAEFLEAGREGADAVELVRLKVDLIIVTTTPAALAVKHTTTTIPVVFPTAIDPVAAGVVGSLARPGGNITGLTTLSPELVGKRLQLLKEAIRCLSRVAVLWNAANPANARPWREGQDAARALGLTLQSFEVRGPTEFESVFAGMARERPDALFVLGDGLTVQHGQQIVNFVVQKRIPSMFDQTLLAVTGGLMGYGPHAGDLLLRAAALVDKILKGAKPADLPIEQPTKFELVVNLKTAKALGLTIPQSLLLRADQVIE